jgi:hypothetical protein
MRKRSPRTVARVLAGSVFKEVTEAGTGSSVGGVLLVFVSDDFERILTEHGQLFVEIHGRRGSHQDRSCWRHVYFTRRFEPWFS